MSKGVFQQLTRAKGGRLLITSNMYELFIYLFIFLPNVLFTTDLLGVRAEGENEEHLFCRCKVPAVQKKHSLSFNHNVMTTEQNQEQEAASSEVFWLSKVFEIFKKLPL